MDCTAARPVRSVDRPALALPGGIPGSVLAARKPVLLFRFAGSFLLRLAERVLFGLLFQEPPRTTREGNSLVFAPWLGRPSATC